MTLSLAVQIEPVLRSKGIDPEQVESITFDTVESARLRSPVIVVTLKPRVERIQVDLVVSEGDAS